MPYHPTTHMSRTTTVRDVTRSMPMARGTCGVALSTRVIDRQGREEGVFSVGMLARVAMKRLISSRREATMDGGEKKGCPAMIIQCAMISLVREMKQFVFTFSFISFINKTRM